MRIQAKLISTFTLLIVLGVTSITSYSIWFIREFMLAEGRERMRMDARLYADAARQGIASIPLPADTTVWISLYDSLGRPVALFNARTRRSFAPAAQPNPYFAHRLASQPDSLGEDIERDRIWVDRVVTGGGPAHYLTLLRTRSELYAPIRVIRWIIYTGMAISILAVVLVSHLFARSLTRPVKKLQQAAQRIAAGDTNARLSLRRNDEFGELANSLNQMASTLTEDNQRLQNLNQALQQAQQLQQQFYADITHEIRNPLHALQGSLDMLNLPALPVEQRQQYLQQAQTQTERLSRLFNDLITLQRSDADPHFVQLQRVPLAPLVRRALEPYEAVAWERGLQVDVAIASDVYVQADSRRLEQVLDNLISNAVKYTERGGIVLRAETIGNEVRVQVSDTGVGIPMEDLPRLTDRFFRTDKARQRDTNPGSLGGTGLGLAVVERILRGHGSQLQVTSQIGQGSTFGFSLPQA